MSDVASLDFPANRHVAEALDRLRSRLTTWERPVVSVTAQVRIVVLRPVLLMATDQSLLLTFTDHLRGSDDVFRLTSLGEIRRAALVGRFNRRLVVRGPSRTWRFSAIEPQELAQRMIEALDPARASTRR